MMRNGTILKTVLLVTMSILLLSGCATEKVRSTRRYVWPLPPDQPKIEWIKSYYGGSNDFPKSSSTVLMETLFGAPEEITFSKPIDIKANSKYVYVTDIEIPGIFRFDLNNRKTEFWPRGTDPDRSLALIPYYISLDNDGNLYAVGTGSKNVFVVNSDGAFLRKFSFADQIKAVAGILVDSSQDRVYIVDNGDGKVAIFDLQGKYISSFGKRGDGDGEFSRPSPIIMNGKGEIIVGDVMNARIQIFNKEVKFLRKFGQRGDGISDFQVLKGVAVDSDDNVYVTDGKANQIKIFNTKGEFLMGFGTAFSVPKSMQEAPGGFLLPQGIYIDKIDNIYVADQANMRFQLFKYLKDAPAKEVDNPLKGGK